MRSAVSKGQDEAKGVLEGGFGRKATVIHCVVPVVEEGRSSPEESVLTRGVIFGTFSAESLRTTQIQQHVCGFAYNRPKAHACHLRLRGG